MIGVVSRLAFGFCWIDFQRGPPHHPPSMLQDKILMEPLEGQQFVQGDICHASTVRHQLSAFQLWLFLYFESSPRQVEEILCGRQVLRRFLQQFRVEDLG